MRHLFEPSAAEDIQGRLQRMRPDGQRQWGTMDAAQALAHCSTGLELALGDIMPPRMLLGRIMGWVVKPLALGNDKPMRRNSPTATVLVVTDARDFALERARLTTLIQRFIAAGPAGCTTQPHSFFGRLTPQEWSILTFKHLDHHLRQFGA